VLPTNFKNFLLDQPKNSAVDEKVRPPTENVLTKANFAVFSVVHDPKR
jgi:hypothetical protein